MGVKVVGEKCCLFLLSPEMPAALRDTITDAYRFTRGSNYDKNLPFVDMECLALAPVYTNARFIVLVNTPTEITDLPLAHTHRPSAAQTCL